MLLLKFSIYLSGAASSLTFCSFCSFNFMYLLRKYKITSIKNTNAVKQPIALPTIFFILFHLSLISFLSSISILIGVESKLNRFLLFIFKKRQNRLPWIKTKILITSLDSKSLPSLDYFSRCSKRNRNLGHIWSRTGVHKNFTFLKHHQYYLIFMCPKGIRVAKWESNDPIFLL